MNELLLALAPPPDHPDGARRAWVGRGASTRQIVSLAGSAEQASLEPVSSKIRPTWNALVIEATGVSPLLADVGHRRSLARAAGPFMRRTGRDGA